VFSANRQCVRLYFDVPGLAYLDLAEAPRTWSIGRAPTNDVVLHDALVSRRHALVSARAGQCTVRDLASRHGLRRNGRPVDVAVLRPGDVLTFAGAVDAQVR
jgi:pSer/pThr/pTyr-binding forkhead associated (FHA) protein